ncbi:MAG TPA: hypothetical protein PLX05_08545 [Acinetobacter parvus]|jgi:hypothetical protein|uniref:hypothetical protein n=1 Tax=Acinetobacter parvus TaxID=134533 RepID=UPI002C6C0BB1|nr:hypothetical protein [Acinetobacter parvus]HRM15661.1 hypothetical protein [Acinetobacter parvus]HRM90750.1 hypothetical protein [Thomasclavelia ramosa]
MKSLKFNVVDEKHSKDIQNEIFNLGGGWEVSGSTDISQEYKYTDKPFIHVVASYKFDQFGDITDEKYLRLTYSEKERYEYNFADHVDEKTARNAQSDLSIKYEVTLDNFREYLHKIGFRSKKENIK